MESKGCQVYRILSLIKFQNFEVWKVTWRMVKWIKILKKKGNSKV